ncbi:type VI secretion system contractile sheath large subunit [Nannocystis sp. SCPEA4]|uniref:type VI secretion system contractile sheath large subunit n=1 Tax=Nannocystis sp. SCPEA4 TaxID=2996787 RepID=UPI00226EC634|nr:type VI secretion system contractile sheath large subunit [Nannocystis sp. SCPEA4]MCY1059598.1 type VI secretion system contractile sheath large subunit [Nannocystis sp. SCPEA4]
MSKPVPRSRLNISYRTQIDGKPKKARLPMRFLVLGEFTGGDGSLLGERRVHSIMPGMKLGSFMEELKVCVPIDDGSLKERLVGALAGEVTGTFARKIQPGDKTASVRIAGTGTVSGDNKTNGLGSFAGEVRIAGEIELPVEAGALVIPADGVSAELQLFGKVEPPQGAEVGITGIVKGACVVRLESNDLADADTTFDLRSKVTSDAVAVEVTIPIRSITDFKPLHIAASVPEIRRLVLLHRLVLEGRNFISSFPELREAVKIELAETRARIADASAGKDTRLGRLQAELRARYPQLVLQPGASPSPSAPPEQPDAESTEGVKSLLDKLIASSGMDPREHTSRTLVHRPADANIVFHDRDPSVSYADRFANALAAFLANVELFAARGEGDAAGEVLRIDSIRGLMLEIDALAARIDELVQERLHRVIRSESLRALEASWRSLDDLCSEVTSEEVIVDFVDTSKDLLRADFEDHSSYILNSALFRKVYVDEYDRYGGKPFGAMIGLYEFDCSDEDVDWLQTMSKICAAAHCPFVAAAGPRFFGVDSWEELERKSDLEELMALPQFGRWDAFRETHGAAYIGLTLPRYMLRAPYKPQGGKRQIVEFEEKVGGPRDYLWGNAAVLFARNMIRSFQTSGWCQHIVGPLGGGMIKGLPVHMVMHHGQEELQPPVEVAIPDYRELQFAGAGFIPLIHCKGTSDATFFSARSVKKALEFEDALDTTNADLICNLAYTLSVTRIAHYVKRMVRDYIGSTADAPYIQSMLRAWLIEYVTTAVNPDDLTLLYYPFKAMSVSVEPKPGPFGWYNCVVSVLPHVQFQGMDVELRLEAALGGA